MTVTKEQVENLKLGIMPVDERTILIVESGMDWIKHNTVLDFDMNNDEDLKALPSRVKLFLIKFFDIQMLGTGVSSESISGLSQSFDTTDKNALLWQFAEELLDEWLKSQMTFHQAKSRW